MNKLWPNILSTIAIIILMAGFLGYLIIFETKPSGSTLLIIASSTALVAGIFVFIRFYFLLVLLKKKRWLGAVCTALQIGVLLWLLYGFVFMVAAFSGIMGVSTNPPH